MKIRQTMFRFPLSVLTHRYMATNTFQGTHRVHQYFQNNVTDAQFNRAGLFNRLFWSLAVITSAAAAIYFFVGCF